MISEVNDPLYESLLVEVLNVQLVENELGSAFSFFSGTNDGLRTLETCNEQTKLSVFTNGEASFANQLFPEGHGTISGVLTSTIEMRTIEDIEFNEPYEVCPVIVPKVMITEVADPKNSTTARFVELFNAGESAINLTSWKLNKYVNGATAISSGAVELNGIIIQPGEFVIIANTGYQTIFGSSPTIESTYISGNGDDVYELVDNSGSRMDIYGIIGEDGNGTNWEYLDGRAQRDLSIKNPNNEFKIGEWIISSNANNSLITHPNTPKNAPEDYNPNYR